MKIEEWMGETLTAGFTALQSCLGIEQFKVQKIENQIPRFIGSGAYIPLINAEDSLLIGILGTPEVTRAITGLFFNDGRNSRTFTSDDIKDAFKELTNIFTGVLKRQLYERAPILKTGLPVFIEGDLALTTNQTPACAHVVINDMTLYFLIIQGKSDYRKSFFQLPECHYDAKQISIQDWMGEALTATFLFSQTALGVENYKVKRIEKQISQPDLMGAYMPLIGTDDAVLIGISATKQEFNMITRAFLGLTPKDEDLSETDTADALKEILNILVGLIKRQIYQHNPFLRTGFPIFVDGLIELTGDQESITALVEMENANAYVTIIRKKTQHIITQPLPAYSKS